MQTIIDETESNLPSVESVFTIIFLNDGSYITDDDMIEHLKKHKDVILHLLNHSYL